jgi:hypothetical protein
LAAPLTQMSEVHSVQTTNPKANQHPEGNKKQRKKSKGDKKLDDNVGKGTTRKTGRRGIHATFVQKSTQPILCP